MNRQMKEKQKTVQTLKKSPVLTGLSFLHATLLLAPVPALLYGFAGAGREVLTRQYQMGGVLILPVVLSWLAVRYCKALWLYVLSGAAAVVLAFSAVPGGAGEAALAPEKLIFAALTAFLWLVRGGVRIKKGRLRKEYMEMPVGEGSLQIPDLSEIPMFLDDPRAVHFFFFVFFYLVSLPLGEETLYRYIFAILCTDLPVCFLYRYLASFREYVEEHQSIANLPVHTMKKIIHLLLVPALLILLLAMLPSLLYGEEPLTRIHVEWSPGGSAPVQENEMPVQETDGMQEMLSQLSGGEAARMPVWLERLLELVVWLIVAAVAFFALRALYLALRSMNRSFLQDEEDEITFLGDEDRREKVKRKREKGGSRFFPSPSERVRRKYKKILRRGMRRRRKTPGGAETPAELEALACLLPAEGAGAVESAFSAEDPKWDGRSADLEILHGLYEKARYSPDGCTEEEAKRADGVNLP